MRAPTLVSLLPWLLVFSATSPAWAQLALVEGPSVEAEAPVYLDARGQRHASLVKMKFNAPVVAVPRGTEALELTDIAGEYGTVRQALLALEAAYGSFTMAKRYPDVLWGETSIVDPRTGHLLSIADLSQWIEIGFDAPVPLADVAALLKAIPEVQFVDAPYVYHLDAEPSDALYDQQWNLDQVSASEAWDLARGFVGDTPPVVIGLSDGFGGADIEDDGVSAAVHPDLRYDPLLGGLRLDNSAIGNRYGDHGTAVAGHAGAITNNGALGVGGSVASLSWTVALKGFEQSPGSIREATCVMPGLVGCNPVDVLNMSWSVYQCSGVPGSSVARGGIDCGELREALDDALGTETVLTGSTGNAHTAPQNPSDFCRPCQPIPGGYYSSQHGRGVLTVNATTIDLSVNAAWNYADPGADPLTQPALAYMDFAVPGLDVLSLWTYGPGQHDSFVLSGTSFSAPTAAALVALLLSVNGGLTHEQITEALVRTADEVVGPSGSYPLPSHTPYSTLGVYGEMWDPYYGYGVLNAYRAVRYVIEHFGGRIGGTTDPFPYVIAEPLTLRAGAELTVRAGTALRVEGDLLVETGGALTLESGATLAFTPGARLVVQGTLYADGTTFTAANPAEGWRGIRVEHGGDAVLHAVVVEHVGDGGFQSSLEGAAVEVVHATATISGQSILRSLSGANPGLGYFHGVSAYGEAGSVEARGGGGVQEETFEVTITGASPSENVRIEGFSGDGLRLAGGAAGYLTGITIQDNAGDGLSLGSDAWAKAHGNTVRDNGGAGIRLTPYTQAIFAGPNGSNIYQGSNLIVDNDGGGLLTDGGGTFQAGAGYSFLEANNWIEDNGQPGSQWFDGVGPDAATQGGGLVVARENWWGRPANPDTTTFFKGGHFGALYVDPMLQQPPSAGGGGLVARRGSESPPVGARFEGTLREALLEAQRLEAEGLIGQALRLLRNVVRDAPGSPLARVALDEGVRLLVTYEPPDALAWLEAQLDRPSHRPWALRALARAYAALGGAAEAATAATALVAEYAGTRHALDGHLALVDLALGSGDLAGAEGALAAAETLAEALEEGEASVSLAATALALAGGDSAPGGGRPGTRRGTGGADSMKTATSESTAGRAEAFQLSVYPNPSSGAAVVRLRVGTTSEGRVEVFDVLGRRVAVLHEGHVGAGEHRLRLDGEALPAGVYVVRATVADANGGMRRLAQAVTVAR